VGLVGVGLLTFTVETFVGHMRENAATVSAKKKKATSETLYVRYPIQNLPKEERKLDCSVGKTYSC